MNTKQIAKAKKLYCKSAKHKVDITITRGACAMRNHCADSERCPLYVQRLVKAAMK